MGDLLVDHTHPDPTWLREQVVIRCLGPLAAMGFNVRGKVASRMFGDIEQRLELITTSGRDRGLSVQLFAIVYAKELMRVLSEDYDSVKPAMPLFNVEPHAFVYPFEPEMKQMPIAHDITSLDRVVGTINRWIAVYMLPFLDETKDVDGIKRQLALGLGEGHHVTGDAFLKTLDGYPAKWRWTESPDDNLKRFGLNPDDYYYGWHKTADESRA